MFIPKIIWIVQSRQLISSPNDRSSHKESTPSMAGASFLFAIVFGLIFIQFWDVNGVSLNLIAALTLMFAIGLKDDLVLSTPRAKIGGELIAIGFVLFCDCFNVSTAGGFLGVHFIPPVLSYILIILMMLTIINSYNMIDGIDGLASTIGIVIFSIYGFIFYLSGLHYYFLLCLILIGVLLAYLRFNLSSTKKIFMGDTGSLIIGFCIGFLSLKFLTMDISLLTEYSFHKENGLIIVAAIFFIPLFDTFRVITIRLINKKSPFYPDNKHIHHILINSGLSHFKASLFLAFLNLAIAVLFICLSLYFNSFIMFGLLVIVFALLLMVFFRLKSNINKKNKFKHLIAAIRFLF